MRITEVKDWLEALDDILAEHEDADRASQMSTYMKNRFKFYGLSSTFRRELAKPLIKEVPKDDRVINTIVNELWRRDQREYQYIGMDILDRRQKVLTIGMLPDLEFWITHRSWWDTVDALSSKITGRLLKGHQGLLWQTSMKWSKSTNMWLNRSSILLQLKYRHDTNTGLLTEMITGHAHVKEFFIEKAIGWALREFSKYRPDWVREFIESHNLRPLSVREGSKYL